MTPYEIKLVALEYQVDTTWQAVMEGFHCGAPEEDQYCGGCVNLMGLYEEAVRSHERAIVAKELNAARQVIAFYASVIKSGEAWSPACESAMADALASPNIR